MHTSRPPLPPPPGGLYGWQWLFMLEGLPSAIMGGVMFFALPETPRDARWLSSQEKELLAEDVRHVI